MLQEEKTRLAKEKYSAQFFTKEGVVVTLRVKHQTDGTICN